VVESGSFGAGFRCAGEFTKHLPSGVTRIQITRGFETKALVRQVLLNAGQTNDLVLTLERLTDLRARGWYGGDSHAHMLHGERTLPVNFDFVSLTAQAEDLHFLSVAQDWNLDDPTPEHLEAELAGRSTANCRLTWNLEAPKNYYRGDAGRCLGHCWNLGMRGRTSTGADVIRLLMNASAWDYESSKPTYANFESHQLIHEQGGVAAYSHPARWWRGSWGGKGGYAKSDNMRISNLAVELPLDTLLGPTYDGLDIITGPGEFEANAKAFQLWSLLLNHGYRITATGSSDACFDRVGGAIPGVPRTYTYIAGAFTFAKAARAVAEGRTFVTTGPLVIAAIDNQPPGTVFSADARARALSIEAWASGLEPTGLRRVEVLRNGTPWRNYTLPEQPGFFQTNLLLRETETAWYCVRAFGAAKQTAVTSAFYFADKRHQPPKPLPAQVHVRVLDAHTEAPIPAYVTELTYAGTVAHEGRRHRIAHGDDQLAVPGTVRLRAEAKGYDPQILSPVLDDPTLLKTITGLTDEDLLKWDTFERLKAELQAVDLVFRLRQNRP